MTEGGSVCRKRATPPAQRRTDPSLREGDSPAGRGLSKRAAEDKRRDVTEEEKEDKLQFLETLPKRSDRLPSCSRIGSFWWRSLLSLVQNFKGLASPIIGNGRTIFFWDDLWNKGIPAQQYPELFSFACNSKLSIKEAKQKEHLFEIFQLPLSEQAYEQYLELNESCEQINIINAKDNWEFIWGSKIFSKKRLSGILWGISRFIAYSNRFRKINMNQSINFSIGYG